MRGTCQACRHSALQAQGDQPATLCCRCNPPQMVGIPHPKGFQVMAVNPVVNPLDTCGKFEDAPSD